MSTFWDKFNQKISELLEQGRPVSPEVKNFQREFNENAKKAEQLFREKERIEEEIRSSDKSSNC